MTVPIKRRSPADQIRYCVDRLNEIHAQSSSEQTALIASRHLLATLAEQLDATVTEPESELSTGAAFLVNAIENAYMSDLQAAFAHLGWPLRFELVEADDRPQRAYCCGNPEDHTHPEEEADD